MPRNPAFKRVCHLAGESIRDYAMIHDGDRILVGVSGGEDSLLLMHVLERLRRHAPISFELHAALIDMGFRGIDPTATVRYCENNGWSIEIIRVPGARLLAEKGQENRPCSFCSRLRRGKLYGEAERLDAGAIALGQHSDDLCVSLLMSLFRGGGLKTMGPNVLADNGRRRLIRPLCNVSKALVRQAALPFGFPIPGQCDYHGQLDSAGDRAWLSRLLDSLESRFPGVRHAMLRSMGDVRVEHLLDPRFLDSFGGAASTGDCTRPDADSAMVEKPPFPDTV